jgi:DNA-binding CsgD family transcriptional regulator/PAS domain-containing protein
VIMALGRSEETEVLRALYADASGTSAWQGFLSRLARLLRAQTAALILADNGPPSLWPPSLWHWGEAAALPDLIHPDDPAHLRRMRAERVYSDSPLPEPHAWRAMRVAVEGGASAWLILQRLGEDFRALDSAQLSALAPHLPQAMAIWQRLARERARAELHQRIAAGMGAGWLVFDAGGMVLDHSATAADLLHATPGLRLDARLRQSDPFGERALAEALERARSGPVALELARAPRMYLLLTPAPPPWPAGACLGVLRQQDHAPQPGPALIAQTYGLSLGEARLALALCQGASLAEAAVALGFTLETARNYSKKIYAATGTRRQGELIALLLRGPLWLAGSQGSSAA